MNKLCLIILSFLFVFAAVAQVPQGISYQAVATDEDGNELVNQDIHIRATVVSNTIDGVEEWIETHQVTTDDFGLFTITIGQGVAEGGAHTDFSNIRWKGIDNFLRIEMDATGGTDFVLMGSNQILSVPYALHSETANMADTAFVALNASNDMDKDSLNEIQLLIYDGTQLSITGGNTIEFASRLFSAPGASADFPQGIVGEYLVKQQGNYTVPNGKTLYMTSGAPYINLIGFGPTGNHMHAVAPNMPIIPSGTIIGDCMCTGFLVDNIVELQAVIIDFSDTPAYTVPAGKILFVKSGMPIDNAANLVVNDVFMEFMRPNFIRASRILSFPAGTLLEKPTDYPELVLTGFLIDENFGN